MTRFDPDPDVIEDRRPTACPFCGHAGSFDGQGDWPDTIEITRVGLTTTYEVTWSQVRCPECNGHFQMLTDSEEAEVTKSA